MSGGEEAALPLVLVVDDFQDNREMFAEFLSISGFRVAEASNGRQAVDLAQKLLPDIILMDLSLPEMDGWEATRVLKADERTRAIPVVALTGHATSGYVGQATEAGCAALLTKPCPPDVLVSEIQRLLSAREHS
jgi:CheY-like chemotaxis protein